MNAPSRASRLPCRNRWLAALVLAAAVAPLAVARGVSPDPAGLGTHTSLGMPPCGFHVSTGLPCATCGMTTAFAHAVRGEMAAALSVQPAAAALALVAGVLALLSATALVGGADLRPVFAATVRPRLLVPGLLFVGVAWGYKLCVVTGAWP